MKKVCKSQKVVSASRKEKKKCPSEKNFKKQQQRDENNWDYLGWLHWFQGVKSALHFWGRKVTQL